MNISHRSALQHYHAAASQSTGRIISYYSTSFSWSTRLFTAPIRRDIQALYAVVRIADEIVDGAAAEAHTPDIRALLDGYEEQVVHAADATFHTDPVLHAWAHTQRRCQISEDHLRAFFASMRRDLDPAPHDAASLQSYIHGSAEVIGLICLDIFLVGHNPSEEDKATMADGAQSLGSAFQKVNFLRDLAEDTYWLGRDYLRQLDADTKRQWCAEIRTELARARRAALLLPPSARRGVLAATGLFAELNERIDSASVDELRSRRIRVPTPRKAQILAANLWRKA
ncbi:squalene/phytoene synthase family protein [Corynebacterium sp. HMSC04H06]|uniref:phytoene/squalene synthase family protein n=1 Tax=Corynebacterium sp. HMSC04H06 TaxID=1581050 RepID=UPI000AA3FF52|nr:squalene/phytoene synthase family protein [Corynebacterium sp. HMSC04H06]